MTGRIVLDDVDEASAQLLLYELSIGEHEAERCGYFTRRPPLLELRRQATEIAHGGPGATLTPCQVPPTRRQGRPMSTTRLPSGTPSPSPPPLSASPSAPGGAGSSAASSNVRRMGASDPR